MRILITRPLADARETEALLQARGHSAVVAPLLEVIYRDGTTLEVDDVQAILATSANGVRALARRTARRDLPIFVVGPQTAAAAQFAGFTTVRNADGDAAALARATALWASADRGVLLHAAGSDAGGELAKSLAAGGFTVRTAQLYDVAAVAELPAAARAALSEGALDAALFYSPRSAAVFAERVVAAGLSTAAGKLIGVCISQATAAALAPLLPAELRVAKRPNQAALLECLG